MRKLILYAALLTTFSCNSANKESNKYATKIVGETIYKSNCASCHKVDMDYTAPALKTVLNVRSKEWVYTFLTNRSKLKEDSLHQKLKILFNTSCTHFPYLSKEEIYAVYNFCSMTGQNLPTQ